MEEGKKVNMEQRIVLIKPKFSCFLINPASCTSDKRPKVSAFEIFMTHYFFLLFNPQSTRTWYFLIVYFLLSFNAILLFFLFFWFFKIKFNMCMLSFTTYIKSNVVFFLVFITPKQTAKLSELWLEYPTWWYASTLMLK